MQQPTDRSATDRQHNDRTDEEPPTRDDRAHVRTNKTQHAQLKALQATLDDLRNQDLEPCSPEDAIEMYLADRRQEIRSSSLTTHKSALRFFAQWCAENEIENLNTLTGRNLHRYRVWRRDEAPTKVDTLSKESEKTQQDIIRQFAKYAEAIDAVSQGLHEKVRSPSLTKDDIARSDIIDPETVQAVLEYLRKYEYGSLRHIVWELAACTGVRIGTLVATDVDDYYPNAEIPHLKIRHRPETETALKNGDSGERLIALLDHVCEAVNDFLETQRPNVTDDHGREPLLATQHGRVARSTIRKYVYQFTRPCEIGQACPHDRDPETCEATTSQNASKCPSSKSPHAIRRGYITHELTAGVDPSHVSNRCNVSEAVIEKHYDERDEFDQLNVRHSAFREARSSSGTYGGEN